MTFSVEMRPQFELGDDRTPFPPVVEEKRTSEQSPRRVR
jgi:hypothetical protein